MSYQTHGPPLWAYRNHQGCSAWRFPELFHIFAEMTVRGQRIAPVPDHAKRHQQQPDDCSQVEQFGGGLLSSQSSAATNASIGMNQ